MLRTTIWVRYRGRSALKASPESRPISLEILFAIAAAASKLAEAKNPIIIGGDAIGYADAWTELQELAELIGAPVLLQTFSSLANFPNNDYHWQGELPGSQSGVQEVFSDHDVAFLCGFSNQAQVTVFKYSKGSLIPPHVQQVVQEYGSAPGYEWQPKTLDPEYLTIERPKIDFVALGSTFGGNLGGSGVIQGEIVRKTRGSSYSSRTRY